MLKEYSENIETDVEKIDWKNWHPKETAALCFIQSDGQLMLIHKKTGLGRGKVNAPGGRQEKGEAIGQTAIRETREEVGLVPSGLQKRGELFFVFADGYSLHATVFFAFEYSGIPVETIEADPFWCPVDKIPYHEMWSDDAYWLPLAIKGTFFRGYFVFDDDMMLSHRIDTQAAGY